MTIRSQHRFLHRLLIRDALQAEEKKLPPDLADTLGHTLTATFEHARRMRNKSGDPTAGSDVTYEEAEAGLLLFPRF